MWRVPLFDLDFDSREEDAVLAVLRRRWLTMGEETQAFEQEFAAMLGQGASCLAVSSCTAALHAAMDQLGLRPGDEVVVPALTFVADANVVAMCRATPVLADCASPQDWNMNARTIARAVTSRTKAVLVVHYAGQPCDMDPIVALCRERGLVLVEDAAHAVGATYRGRQCGTFGDMACFSFFSNKNLSCGEGGMFVTRDPDRLARARLFRSHGMTSLTLDRHKGRVDSYDVLAPGLNYRMTEMSAALGRVQLAKLEGNNARRERLAAAYATQLDAMPGVVRPWPGGVAGCRSACHIMPVLLPKRVDRAALMAGLRGQGIQSSIHYPDMQQFTAYKDLLRGAPVAAEICARELTLPLFPSMSMEMVHEVVALLRALLRQQECK
ncbi:DegT/DnrJ/EryC1/StrS family aminotransferase [Solidesulfovibrio magneticus]|uniref:DegT/DnrJ/EryC1/StrS aminotransferase family protein n=1 Tax=Solidesulfovibrio magneticus (strain ATCC 700980 / DSM 13731 / RS-1) TaxID=573370 RepID=C4XP26_SOLM1|nr:DegT/DnrJ/EryC1/StrS family aminotransferase [Solidesulfovibrio magneticus]BAH77527.1 DegT/DnrJ/EryC1/StrS aminotransferase family protein [Solidesulfovibrio magneticus RS-1]